MLKAVNDNLSVQIKAVEDNTTSKITTNKIQGNILIQAEELKKVFLNNNNEQLNVELYSFE